MWFVWLTSWSTKFYHGWISDDKGRLVSVGTDSISSYSIDERLKSPLIQPIRQSDPLTDMSRAHASARMPEANRLIKFLSQGGRGYGNYR